VIAPIVVAVIGGVSGTFALGPYRYVHDHAITSIRVEDARYSGSIPSLSSSQVVELGGQSIRDHHLGSSDNSSLQKREQVLVGEIAFDEILGSHGPVELHRPLTQPEVYQGIFFTLVGRHYLPVQIVGMRARAVARHQPLAGTLVYVLPQGGDISHNIGFDLDSDRLDGRIMKTVMPYDGLMLTTRNYFDDNQITLSQGEHVSFGASVFTSACRCDFVVDVMLSDGSTVTVDNHGRPWVVSGFSARYARTYVADTSSGKFLPCEYPFDCFDYYKRHPY
jgi:hypothetical protein